MLKNVKTSFLALISLIIIGTSVANAEGIRTSVFVWYPSGQVQRASPNGEGMFYQACIHPHGGSVIFSGNVSGGPRIWERNLFSQDIKALTPENTASLHGVYSWDGDSIAFTSDINTGKKLPTFVVESLSGQGQPPAGSVMNIHVMDSDGRNIRQLTFGNYTDQRPTFSPDGKTITFVRLIRHLEKMIPTLWSVSTDGSGQAAPIVLSGTGWAYRPWYSRDGRTIYFFTIDEKSRHRIASVSVEGGDIEFLAADNEGRSHGPFVDSNGETLLMHSTRGKGDQHKIWEIPLSGGPPIQLMPPGFDPTANVMHATRSKNGILAFDTY